VTGVNVAERPRISILSFASAPAEDQERGLLGWLSLDVDGLLLLDGVVLRRTRQGRLALSFPAPRDWRGRRKSRVRPLHDAARRAIEGAVLGALDGQEGVR
jgi:hypothetical protein